MTGWIIFGSILLVLILILAQSVTVTAVYDRNPEIRIRILCFTIVRVPPDEKMKKKKAAKQAKKEAREAKKTAKQAKKAEKEARRNASSAAEYEKKLDEQREALKQNGSSDKNGNTDSGTQSEAPADDADKHKTQPGSDAGNGTAPRGHNPPPKKKFSLSDINFDMIRDYIESAAPPVKRLFKKIRIRDVYLDYVVGSDDAAKTALKYGGLCAAVYSAAEWLKTYFSVQIKELNIEADFSAEKDDIFFYVNVKLRISTILGCGIWLAVRLLKTYMKYNQTPAAKPKRRPA